MKITFAGAAHEVTGSCYYVETKTAKFTVDCGLFQGDYVSDAQNDEPFPFNPKELDFVLLTHAHLDHCGRLPILYKQGFRGKIYTVEPTVDLTTLILEDAAGLIADEADREGHTPLYTEKDAEKIISQMVGCRLHNSQTEKGVEFTFYDAGHILGSASVQIVADGLTVVFSGDLGNPPQALLPATEFITKADYVVMESTYGGFRHEDYHLRQQRLVRAIKNSVAQGGILLIPAFAVERSQEILYDINNILEAGKLPSFPMFLDSPLAIKATEVFRHWHQYYNREALHDLMHKEDLFDFPGLKLTKTTDESKMINQVPPPKVIMAGSGMMHGGRIMHHLQRYVDNPKCTILIVGYMVKNTLGRQLLDKALKVRIYGAEHQVKAHVEAIGAYSSHADQPKLLEWVNHFTPAPKKIFITHGEEKSSQALAESIQQTVGIPTEIPYLKDRVILT